MSFLKTILKAVSYKSIVIDITEMLSKNDVLTVSKKFKVKNSL